MARLPCIGYAEDRFWTAGIISRVSNEGINALDPDHPEWQHPLIVYLPSNPGASWTAVGLESNA